jgi:hypothetical protein
MTMINLRIVLPQFQEEIDNFHVTVMEVLSDLVTDEQFLW